MAARLRERSYMGQRLIYQLDLLDLKRRRRYEGAARRNGKRLSVWLREVADAAAERQPLPSLPAEVEVDLTPAPGSRVLVHEHTPKVLPWGGRVCEGCGELL